MAIDHLSIVLTKGTPRVVPTYQPKKRVKMDRAHRPCDRMISLMFVPARSPSLPLALLNSIKRPLISGEFDLQNVFWIWDAQVCSTTVARSATFFFGGRD